MQVTTVSYDLSGMRPDVYQVIEIAWLAVFVVWWVAALTVKRAVHSKSGWRARVAVGGVWLAWFFLFNPALRRGLLAWRFVPMGPAAAYTGLALTMVGLALSLWARFYIGRNWNALVVFTENHQLVRSGPYAIVRHPIYAGFMLATLGTAIAFGQATGLVAVALIVISWGYKSRLEEALMIEQFGAEYEQYRREVKGLIPLVC